MINIKKSNDIFVITMEVKERPVNVITEGFLSVFETMIEEITRDPETRGLIITSGRDKFMAGEDLDMLLSIEDPKTCFDIMCRLQKVYRRMETWGRPVVAAINGTALGAGFELALACNHRISLRAPDIRIGLPEASIGLLPACGGIQKAYYLMGLKRALPMLLSGKVFTPERALVAGLIDDIVEDKDNLISSAEAFIDANVNTEVKQIWDENPPEPGRAQDYQTLALASVNLQAKGVEQSYRAPMAILSCLHQTLRIGMNAAPEVMIRHFTDLVFSPTSRSTIRTLFYGVNRCKKLTVDGGTKNNTIKKVGVLGAGMMGRGIAFASAQVGIDVVLKDVDEKTAAAGKGYSEKLVEKLVSRGNMTRERGDELLSHISTTTKPEDMAGCDLVIEAVGEDRSLKAKVTAESEAAMKSDAIFASNTSTLPITGLAEASHRSDKFIGLHFFSPVERMPLLEIIPGEKTSSATLERCLGYAKALDKTPIIVGDSRGFYTTRVFITYVSEGFHCLKEGIPPIVIERAGKQAGMAVGPLAVSDEISLELIYHIFKQTIDDVGTGGVDQVAWEVVSTLVETHKLYGRKSGSGFYDYSSKSAKPLNPKIEEIFPSAPNIPPIDQIAKRLLTIQSLETLRCFEEKIVPGAIEADVGSVLGWGFPAYTGGALGYIEMIGPEQFLSDCEEFHRTHGPRFSPTKLIKSMAIRGETGLYS